MKVKVKQIQQSERVLGTLNAKDDVLAYISNIGNVIPGNYATVISNLYESISLNVFS